MKNRSFKIMLKERYQELIQIERDYKALKLALESEIKIEEALLLDPPELTPRPLAILGNGPYAKVITERDLQTRKG